MSAPDAPDLFREDAEKVKSAVRQRLQDFATEHAPRWLVTFAGGTVLSNIVAIAVLPAVAAAACIAMSIASLTGAYYSRRLMYREQRARAWVQIRLMREELKMLELEQSLDNAVLVIGDQPQDSHARSRSQPAELRQAVAYLKGRRRAAIDTAAPTTGRAQARAAQRASAPPKAPDFAAVRRRMDERATRIEALKAARESEAVPGDKAAAALAKETDEERRAAYRRAAEADRAARERKRQGRAATGSTGQRPITIAFSPDGERAVGRGDYAPTPEEIADGRTSEPEKDS